MTDRIDHMLKLLRATPAEEPLDRLESAVWARIDKQSRGDVFGGRTLQVQFAVTCGALLLGLAVAELASSGLMPRPLNSELIVLSDDSAMAPSVRLEGGI